jgi:DNA sulfur modification protein DndC
VVTDDVWEFLGYCSAGMMESYSDFQETMRFYRDAGGSSCAVVADMKMNEVARMKGGCGARSGCWACVRISKDKSLEQMIEGDLDRYGYLAGLNRLRDFIAYTQFDWDRRTFLGRTIDDNGDVAIGADVYSPSMLEELLRYTLTLQAKEQRAAARKGIAPRFTIIGYRELIAIDTLWSLYGLHKPFHALKIFGEVNEGAWSEIPRVVAPDRTPVPRYGKLHVGRTWEQDRLTGDPARDRIMAGGIRSPIEEMFSESCGHGVRENSRGDLVTSWDTGLKFDVDEDGAADFVNLMSEEYIEEHHNDRTDRTTAVMTYLGFGFVTPAHGSLMRWHEIARRTQWMQRQGLVGQVQRKRLLEMLQAQSLANLQSPQAEAAPAEASSATAAAPTESVSAPTESETAPAESDSVPNLFVLELAVPIAPVRALVRPKRQAAAPAPVHERQMALDLAAEPA